MKHAPTSNGRLPFDPERDRELAFRFGQDVVVTASSFLACVLWPLGEVDRARRLAEEMVVQAVRGGHIATIAWVRVVHSLFEVMFGSPVRATTNVTEAVAVAREHGMKLWMAFGGFLEPWAHSHTDDRDASIKGMLHGIAMLEEQGVWLYGPLLWTALAKAKAEAGQFESALGAIDRAIAETERTGQCWYEAETRRIRGEILLKRHPANTVPAEKLSSLPSPPRNNKRRGASSCARRCRWPRSINPPGVPRTPTPSSWPRSKASRRRRNFPRSRKHRRFLRRLPKQTK